MTESIIVKIQQEEKKHPATLQWFSGVVPMSRFGRVSTLESARCSLLGGSAVEAPSSGDARTPEAIPGRFFFRHENISQPAFSICGIQLPATTDRSQ